MKEENHEQKINTFFIFGTFLVIALRKTGLMPGFFYKLKKNVLGICCVNFRVFCRRVLMLYTLLLTHVKFEFSVRRAQFRVKVARLKKTSLTSLK